MGGSSSSYEEREQLSAGLLFNESLISGVLPDIGIDCSLIKYSGLNSTAELERYSSELFSVIGNNAPGFIASLGSSLSGFKAIPHAVGLGALIISFILDITAKTFTTERSDNVQDMLRRVFAEEKAEGVKDTMDEFMKRYYIFVQEPSKVLVETERLEKQLSNQLTRLRNSMLNSNHMSSQAMKHWTNGAAFHSQMFIHAARLKRTEGSMSCKRNLDTCVTAISNLVDLYIRDLQDLLKKYENFKRSTISFNLETSFCYGPPCMGRKLKCRAYDSELKLLSSSVRIDIGCAHVLDAYIKHMFNNWNQIKDLKDYFTDLKENIKKLILQDQYFTMQNISPASGSPTDK